MNTDINNIPEKLYHATYSDFLDSIKENGLGNIRNKINSYSKPGTVALSTSIEDALASIEWTEWVENSDDYEYYYDSQVVLEIDTNKLIPYKLKLVDENLMDYEYAGIIPWDACTVVTENNLKHDISNDVNEYDSLWD